MNSSMYWGQTLQALPPSGCGCTSGCAHLTLGHISRLNTATNLFIRFNQPCLSACRGRTALFLALSSLPFVFSGTGRALLISGEVIRFRTAVSPQAWSSITALINAMCNKM